MNDVKTRSRPCASQEISRSLIVRIAFGLGLGSLGLILLTSGSIAAEASPPPHASLAARLSDAPRAMEYWDVTAWFESGDRFFARFLITNQGPGLQTAAVVGRLVLSNGEVVPFQWGRRRDAWTLGPERESLAIASAKLDLGGTAVVVEVDSATRGIALWLAIARSGPLVSTTPMPADYSIDVAMPAAAQGRIRTRGMATTRAVVGSGAVTHTWIEQPEGDLLRRRVDLLARNDDDALYLCELTLADGSRRSTAVASRTNQVLARDDDLPFSFSNATTVDGDPRYPVAADWKAAGTAVAARVTVGRELLRMDPLDIIPQPFRMLVALSGRPQRMWAEAKIMLRLTPLGKEPPVRSSERGIVAETFARPTARQ